jgi:hypothetical protein
MQLDCHPIPIDLMHNQVTHKVKPQNKIQGHLLDAPGLSLIQSKLLGSSAITCSTGSLRSGST